MVNNLCFSVVRWPLTMRTSIFCLLLLVALCAIITVEARSLPRVINCGRFRGLARRRCYINAIRLGYRIRCYRLRVGLRVRRVCRLVRGVRRARRTLRYRRRCRLVRRGRTFRRICWRVYYRRTTRPTRRYRYRCFRVRRGRSYRRCRKIKMSLRVHWVLVSALTGSTWPENNTLLIRMGLIHTESTHT